MEKAVIELEESLAERSGSLAELETTKRQAEDRLSWLGGVHAKLGGIVAGD